MPLNEADTRAQFIDPAPDSKPIRPTTKGLT